MNVNINNSMYNLHIIDEHNFDKYEKILSKIEICDRKYISQFYEKTSYEVLELDGYVGFLLTDINNMNLFNTCIIDVNCSQIKENTNDEIDINDSVEIVLLCANYKMSVSGLTKSFFDIIIDSYIPQYKKNVKKILLKVAKNEDNNRAINFYLKIGFTPLIANIMIYNYKNVGGKKRHQYNSKKRYKNITKRRNKYSKPKKRICKSKKCYY